MSSKAISVRSHKRVPRKDRVGDALRAATKLRKERSVRDWAIQYSREHDDPKAEEKDRILWHLDPVELRSVVTQMQARLRQRRDAVVITGIDGKDYQLEKAVSPGEFAHLLGRSLSPSIASNGKNPGKDPRWCGGVLPVTDQETPPDGLSIPSIISLGDLATAAGVSVDLVRIARVPVRNRALEIKEKRDDYLKIIRANGSVAELQSKNQKLEGENLQLTQENQNLSGKLRLLDFIDIERLQRDYSSNTQQLSV